MDLKAVIFDFDYTLADSSQGAIECINFALDQMKLARVSDEAACRTIGLSLHETFLTLGDHHEPQRCDEFYGLFVQRAEEVMSNLTELYDSVPGMVETLRESGLNSVSSRQSTGAAFTRCWNAKRCCMVSTS
jgi:phosphoglycolate phosphatase